MQKIKHVDEIFKLLKNELEKYNMPVVSHPDWADIVKTPFTTLIS